MNSVIPTLSLNKDQLTTPREQIAYLIRQAFYNPGWTSSQIDYTLVSIRKYLAEHTEDSSRFIPALQNGLQAAITAYQPTYKVTVNAKTNSANSRAYTVVIRVTDENDTLVLQQDDISVENGILQLHTDKEQGI